MGHGIFTLRHTFEVNYSGDKFKSATTNLMDYNNGSELAVWQWNVMANPAPLTWFDSEEDSKSISLPYLNVVKKWFNKFETSNPCIKIVSIEQYDKGLQSRCKIVDYSFSTPLSLIPIEKNKIVVNYIIRSTGESREIIISDFTITNISIIKKLGTPDNATLNELGIYLEQLMDIAAKGTLGDLAKIPNIDTSECIKQLSAPQVLAIFIGGAGDKKKYYVDGPNYFVRNEVKNDIDKKFENNQSYFSLYLGYDEVYGNQNIEDNVIRYITKKNTKIYIVGHSLGGWNSAHLSQILTDRGYDVSMLITLDPVGEGALVYAVSNIYYSTPKPKTEYWINILCSPTEDNQSDKVADFGERWKMNKDSPNIYHVTKRSHNQVGRFFNEIIYNNKSTKDILIEYISKTIEHE